MSTVSVNGTHLFYKTYGQGKETIVFSHGYLLDHTMFDGQIDTLKQDFRCVSFEHRGHGNSEIASDGYSMTNIVDDAIAVIESLDCGPVHFVGMSTGGFVGMRIALKRPDLLKSLVLMSTSAQGEPKQAHKRYRLMLSAVRYLGWWAVMGKVTKLLFHSSFFKNSANKQTVNYWKQVIKNQDNEAMIKFGEAIFSRDDVLDKLANIETPTQVIIGKQDGLTRLSCSQRMAETIPNAVLCEIDQAGHGVAIEKPTDVTNAMLSFYKSIQPSED